MPKFIPDASNAALSFNHWLGQFKVELALVAARAGKTPGEDPVDIYNDRLKLLSSFSAIRPTGVSALEATGYDTNDPLTPKMMPLHALKSFTTARKQSLLASNAFSSPNKRSGRTA